MGDRSYREIGGHPYFHPSVPQNTHKHSILTRYIIIKPPNNIVPDVPKPISIDIICILASLIMSATTIGLGWDLSEVPDFDHTQNCLLLFHITVERLITAPLLEIYIKEKNSIIETWMAKCIENNWPLMRLVAARIPCIFLMGCAAYIHHHHHTQLDWLWQNLMLCLHMPRVFQVEVLILLQFTL